MFSAFSWAETTFLKFPCLHKSRLVWTTDKGYFAWESGDRNERQPCSLQGTMSPTPWLLVLDLSTAKATALPDPVGSSLQPFGFLHHLQVHLLWKILSSPTFPTVIKGRFLEAVKDQYVLQSILAHSSLFLRFSAYPYLIPTFHFLSFFPLGLPALLMVGQGSRPSSNSFRRADRLFDWPTLTIS